QYKAGIKNYSDKNGNDVTKAVYKGRKTFALWTLDHFAEFPLPPTPPCRTIHWNVNALKKHLSRRHPPTVNIKLGLKIILIKMGTMSRKLFTKEGKHSRSGLSCLESMEFLPEHNAIKFFGDADLDHVYKRDGLIESFRDEPMSISSENGSVVLSRSDTRVTVNTSGVFIRGVSSLELRDPTTGEAVSLRHARDGEHVRSVHPRRAEGTHMESKELSWTADQDIHIRSINGSVVLSGKEGVYIDVRYLPIAMPLSKAGTQATGQFKVCVCMPQGKLFRIAVPTGQKVTCSHINMTGDMNPCV
ncbi:putative beta-sarcoglycan, partial [Operophtera brumata]